MRRALAPAFALSLLVALPGAHAAQAGNETLATDFGASSETRQISFSYDGLTTLLGATVFDPGRSDRVMAPPRRPDIGRRFVLGNSSSLRLEGNRIYFRAIKDHGLEYLTNIRRSLEAMPTSVPMAKWTKPQQLAYWLNLYNTTMLEALARDYPKRDIRKLLYGRGHGDGLLDQKLLHVAGHALSLNDIQYRILLPGWHSPMVMYGLFKGYVGSPNLRRKAYSADTVYDDLRDNAVEFVNSNRGARVYRNRLIVSRFYKEIAPLFPNFSASLKKHIADLADPDFAVQVRATHGVKATTHDYYIADVMQGVTSDANPNQGNIAGLVTSVIALSPGASEEFYLQKGGTLARTDMPSVASDYATRVAKKKAVKKGEVSVEEVSEDTKKKGGE